MVRQYVVGLNHGPKIQRVKEEPLYLKAFRTCVDSPHTRHHAKTVERSRQHGFNRTLDMLVGMSDGTQQDAVRVIRKYDDSVHSLERTFINACSKMGVILITFG